MNTENNLVAAFEPLDEAQLVQQFQVEELEKRYEFGWGGKGSLTGGYSEKGGFEMKVTYSWSF